MAPPDMNGQNGQQMAPPNMIAQNSQQMAPPNMNGQQKGSIPILTDDTVK